MSHRDAVALERSRAADLIFRTLTFTDWTRRPDDELERVAMRLLEQVEDCLRDGAA